MEEVQAILGWSMVDSKVGSNRFVLQGFAIGFKNSYQPETCTTETIAI